MEISTLQMIGHALLSTNFNTLPIADPGAGPPTPVKTSQKIGGTTPRLKFRESSGPPRTNFLDWNFSLTCRRRKWLEHRPITPEVEGFKFQQRWGEFLKITCANCKLAINFN